MIGKKPSPLTTSDVEKLISTAIDKKLNKATKNVAKMLATQIKISELPAGGAITGTEQFEVNKAGVSVSQTANQLRDYIELNDVSPAYGATSFQDNSTETVISTISTPVKVNGTYIAGLLQDFTELNGVLTYTGTVPRVFTILATTTETFNLINANVSLSIAIDGVQVSKSRQSPDLDGLSPSFSNNTVFDLLLLNPGQTVEVMTQNNGNLNDPGVTGTENITHKDIKLIVGAPGFTGAATASSNILFSQTEEQTVIEDSDAIEQIDGTGIGSMFIAANTVQLGDTYELVMAGTIQTNGASQTISFRLSDGTGSQNIFFNTGGLQLANNPGLTPYIIRARGTFQKLGANTVARLHTVTERPKIGTTVNEQVGFNFQTIGADTTIDINYKAYVQWGAASPNNKVTCNLLTFSKI